MSPLVEHLLKIIDKQQDLIDKLSGVEKFSSGDITKTEDYKPIKGRMGPKEVIQRLEQLHKKPHPTEEYWLARAQEANDELQKEKIGEYTGTDGITGEGISEDASPEKDPEK